MELFSEIYGCYYNVVAGILQNAAAGGITKKEIDEIVKDRAFSESGYLMIPKLLQGEWDLLEKREDKYYSKLRFEDTSRPLTTLEKSWLLALLSDRRIQLFLGKEKTEDLLAAFSDVEPLFSFADFHIFDGASDGDNYEEESYIVRFRQVLNGIKEKKPLLVYYEKGKGGSMGLHILPLRMLYSQKDDKFRLIAVQMIIGGKRKEVILNMGRIKEVEDSLRPVPEGFSFEAFHRKMRKKASVTLAVTQERNALERSMLQFASFEKQTVFDEEADRYLCTIYYDPLEETELLIRILSFGPTIEVVEPADFRKKIKERIERQIQWNRS